MLSSLIQSVSNFFNTNNPTEVPLASLAQTEASNHYQAVDSSANELQASINTIVNEVDRRNNIGYGLGAAIGKLLGYVNAPVTDNEFSSDKPKKDLLSKCHDTIAQGDHSEVKEILSNSAFILENINNLKEGKTALSIACSRDERNTLDRLMGNENIATKLLAAGANPYAHDSLALKTAIEFGQDNMVLLLIDKAYDKYAQYSKRYLNKMTIDDPKAGEIVEFFRQKPEPRQPSLSCDYITEIINNLNQPLGLNENTIARLIDAVDVQCDTLEFGKLYLAVFASKSDKVMESVYNLISKNMLRIIGDNYDQFSIDLRRVLLAGIKTKQKNFWNDFTTDLVGASFGLHFDENGFSVGIPRSLRGIPTLNKSSTSFGLHFDENEVDGLFSVGIPRSLRWDFLDYVASEAFHLGVWDCSEAFTAEDPRGRAYVRLKEILAPISGGEHALCSSQIRDFSQHYYSLQIRAEVLNRYWYDLTFFFLLLVAVNALLVAVNADKIKNKNSTTLKILEEMMQAVRVKIANGQSIESDEFLDENSRKAFYEMIIEVEKLLEEQIDAPEHVQFKRYFSVVKLFIIDIKRQVSNINDISSSFFSLYYPIDIDEANIPFHSENAKGQVKETLLTILNQFDMAFKSAKSHNFIGEFFKNCGTSGFCVEGRNQAMLKWLETTVNAKEKNFTFYKLLEILYTEFEKAGNDRESITYRYLSEKLEKHKGKKMPLNDINAAEKHEITDSFIREQLIIMGLEPPQAHSDNGACRGFRRLRR